MKYVMTPNVVSCEIQGGRALLSTARNVYFSLNDTASLIWEQLDEPKSIDELARILADNYETVPEACSPDVVRLVVALEEFGLVDVIES